MYEQINYAIELSVAILAIVSTSLMTWFFISYAAEQRRLSRIAKRREDRRIDQLFG